MADQLDAAHDIACLRHCAPAQIAWRDRFGGDRSKGFDDSPGHAADLSNLGTIIRERCEALGLTPSRPLCLHDGFEAAEDHALAVERHGVALG